MRSSAKARQTKSKARLARYEEMLDAPQKEELSHSASIYIPPGPRLGKQVVEAKGVRKGFGERTLIDGLTFSLPPGGIVGVVGPNGAGKTTLVRMLTGEQAAISPYLPISPHISPYLPISPHIVRMLAGEQAADEGELLLDS